MGIADRVHLLGECFEWPVLRLSFDGAVAAGVATGDGREIVDLNSSQI